MSEMNRNEIVRLKKIYQPGMRIKLISMNDPQAPEAGSTGTVQGVDDLGNILMEWDNGSTLSIIPNEDEFKRIR